MTDSIVMLRRQPQTFLPILERFASNLVRNDCGFVLVRNDCGFVSAVLKWPQLSTSYSFNDLPITAMRE
jgi:hypothetical protein